MLGDLLGIGVVALGPLAESLANRRAGLTA